MELTCTLRHRWKDEFLTWRPDMNDGIKEISVPGDKIWKPDFVPYNSISDMVHVDGYPVKVLVAYDGTGQVIESFGLDFFEEGLK